MSLPLTPTLKWFVGHVNVIFDSLYSISNQQLHLLKAYTVFKIGLHTCLIHLKAEKEMFQSKLRKDNSLKAGLQYGSLYLLDLLWKQVKKKKKGYK